MKIKKQREIYHLQDFLVLQKRYLISFKLKILMMTNKWNKNNQSKNYRMKMNLRIILSKMLKNNISKIN